jgi:hypothetical protein
MNAKEKLEEIIEVGKVKTSHIMEDLTLEVSKRQDTLVKPNNLSFEISPAGIFPIIDSHGFSLNSHSRNQMFKSLGMPMGYANKLIELEELKLLNDNLMTLSNTLEDGVLVRTVGDKIKGWLPPNFRMSHDTLPILQAFVDTSIEAGMVPYGGVSTDLRNRITFIHPEVFSPSENEAIVFGVTFQGGDYGDVNRDIFLSALRIMCTNLAVGISMYENMKLGNRLEMGENELFEFSDKTISLDLETIRSAVTDIVGASKKQFEIMKSSIADAVNRTMSIYDVAEFLKAQKYPSRLIKTIMGVYQSDVGEDQLPSKPSLWRVSNAVSFYANTLEDEEKRMNLQNAAMDLLLNVN